MTFFNIIDFFKKIPNKNKELQSDFLASMLFMSVRLFLKKEREKAGFILQNICFFANIKNPVEWRMLEYSYFLSLYFNQVDVNSDEYYFYMKKFKKKVFIYYKVRRKDIMNFYGNLSYSDVRRVVKKNLRRRWNDKSELDIFINAASDAMIEKDVSSEWCEVVSAYIETIFLFYVAKNIKYKEIEILEKRALKLLKNNEKKINLAPFEEFLL